MWIDCQAIMDRTGYTAVYEEDLTDTQKTMLRTSLVKFWSTLFDPSEITFIMGDTVVGTMKMPEIDLVRGDTLTLSGIKDKLKAEVV